jgi:NAD+ kinase
MNSSSSSSMQTASSSPPSSTAGSPMPSVERAAVVTHGRTKDVGDALARLRAVAASAGVELLFDAEEAAKHGVAAADTGRVDIAIVLGGDGTMLRALTRFLGSQVPVLGVNFGRVGFLTAIPDDRLEPGLARVFAGDFRVIGLPTLEVELAGERRVAINDTVVASATPGRMIELGYSIGGEELGTQPCDGLICATPSGSTAYNLSNGGPVLVWGLEAMVITFVAPHSLHSRPLVVGPETDLVVTNRSAGVAATVLVDGHPFGELPPGEQVVTHLGSERSLLATLPERSFFQRYVDVFGAA